MRRDLIAIDDLSDDDVRLLLREARRCETLRQDQSLRGAILATLFLEPSTRTRLSFEAAMHRLGGAVITSADPATSSSAKGESLADTVRMVDGYADVIVLRHPAAGAARAAAKVASAPILNAGDGGHEHPSQTLVDLYTLERERGSLEGLRVVLYGDLRYGRTAHSLVRALWRFRATVLLAAEPGLELPAWLLDLLRRQGAVVTPLLAADSGLPLPDDCKPALIGPRGAPAPDAFDAIYVTRVQKERLPAARAGLSLPPVDAQLLARGAFARAIVMHPLPRMREIDPGIDADPRAAYFRQAQYGVPVRMALLLAALGRIGIAGPTDRTAAVAAGPAEACVEPTCISVKEPHSAAAEWIADGGSRRRCAYCEHAWPEG